MCHLSYLSFIPLRSAVEYSDETPENRTRIESRGRYNAITGYY